MQNVKAVLTERAKFSFVYGDAPSPAEGELLIKLEEIGICGSDAHFFDLESYRGEVLPYPYLLGHECAGIVVETGKGVKHFSVGDRVALEPQIPCGTCEYCMQGRYNLCRSLIFLGAKLDDDGALQKYIVWPQHMVHHLPDSMSFSEGVLLEPFSVGLHAATRAGVSCGKSVTILGAGCIGLMSLLACKAMGASKVIITDVFENRLELAKRMGADYTINAAGSESEAQILACTDGKGSDVVIETAGAPATLRQSVRLVKCGGVIALIGMNFGLEVPFNFFALQVREVDIRTVFRYRNLYPLAIELCASGKANIKQVITHSFAFSAIQEAFTFANTHKQEAVKVMLEMDK